LVTTEAGVAEAPKKKEEHSHMPGGGMGGMDMMYASSRQTKLKGRIPGCGPFCFCLKMPIAFRGLAGTMGCREIDPSRITQS
jgi:hypothetical protein